MTPRLLRFGMTRLALVLIAALVTAGVGFADAVPTPFAQCAQMNGVAAECGSGWYTSPVTVIWKPNGGSVDAGCSSQYYSQDVDQSSLSDAALPPAAFCTVTNGSYTVTTHLRMRVEISSPVATAAPNRAPDFNSWYNHPVAAVVQGSAFSGIQSCAGTTYAGPDTSGATVSGSCTDNAGKVVSATSAPFPYDATPPAIDVAADPGDRLVVLRWPVSSDLTLLTIQRSPGVRGSSHSVLHRGDSGLYRDARVRNHIPYRYTITARDQAGNTTVQTLVIRPGPRLLNPGPNADVGVPLLSWTPVRGADYYNIQLFRNRKVLSAWPSHAFLQLRRVWRFQGRHYRLRPGRYRWYVWPGFGRRAAARYGPLIGSRSFVVA